jgi:hypothetical protein
MSAPCRQILDWLDGYAMEALSAEERRAVREHLSRCADCRAEAVAADPLFFFAGSGPASLPEKETSRILEAVRAGVAWKQAESRIESPARRRRWSALVSAAAAVVLTLWLPGAAGRRTALKAPEAPRAAAETGFAPAAVAPPSGELLEPPGGRQKYPADATIYDWNPGAGQPRVVWIVDRSIDI